MPLKEQSLGYKILEDPVQVITPKFLGNLTAYFMRQNKNYGIKVDFGLAPAVYKDYKDYKLAEARQEFMLNRVDIIRKWMQALQTRLSEIKLTINTEELTSAELTQLGLEAMEIERQIIEFSDAVGIEYAGQRRQYSFRLNDT